MSHERRHGNLVQSLIQAAGWLRRTGEKNLRFKKQFDEAADRDVAAAAAIEELEKELENVMAKAQDNVAALLAKEQALKAQVTDLQAQLATAQGNADLQITPELNASVEAEVTPPAPVEVPAV